MIITCPKCNHQIEVSDTLSDQLKADLTTQLTRQHQAETKRLEQQLTQLKIKQAQVDQEVAKRVATEVKSAQLKIAQQATESQAKQLQDLQEQLAAKNKQLSQAEKHEQQLRKKARELEEKEQRQELEIARKLDVERKKLVDQQRQLWEEEQHLKAKEKDHQIEQMRKTISDLKRQSEQGSMQVQGDAQENDLKNILTSLFPVDHITDVPTGMRGADLVQTVQTSTGQPAGVIVWESKNTKQWSTNWLSKLKQDQGKVEADIAVIVSQVLPEEIKSFGRQQGIWITGYRYVGALAAVLRSQLLELAKVKTSLAHQDEHLHQLHQYLMSSQFKNRVENMASAFTQMQQDLETEKRSLQRIWSKREKELQRLMLNTSSLYGDLQGILGAGMPKVEQLELPVE